MILCLLAALATGTTNARADGSDNISDIRPVPVPVSKNEPVLFTADHVEQDAQTHTIILTGHVELTQKPPPKADGTQSTGAPQVVQADKLTYHQDTGQLVAEGHVAFVQPSGDVVFADYAELSSDLSTAFAKEVGALLSDNSRMAGRAAERRDGRWFDIAQGVYSPCQLCKDDPTQPPLWQLKAEHITHDMQEHQLTYDDAWLEFMGLPVAYTPYLSVPDPTVKRRSGFLAPTLGINTVIGTSLRTPYYIDIAPDKDLTVAPTFSSEDGLQLAGDYRERWQNGKIDLNASGTFADLVKDYGPIQRDIFRGDVQGTAQFDLNETWRTGADIFLSSDDTYLQRYRIAAPDILTNRLYIEGFDRRDYAAAESFYFQDTRPGLRPVEPYVVPRLQAEHVTDPDTGPIGGRWSLDSSLLSLERPGDSTDTRRLSSSLDWQKVQTMPVGLVSTTTLDARADLYDADNFTDPRTDITHDTTDAGRIFPYAEESLSYPMSRQFGSVQQTLEPIVSLLAAPTVTDSGRFPNEDSLDFELDDTNLFDANRFTGVDRQEGGARITYGIKTGVYGFGGGSSSLFLGQSYRLQDNNTFPEGSGLADQWSDYVGRLVVDPAPWMDVNYSFRFDHDTLQPKTHDVDMTLGDTPFRLSVNYLFVDATAGTLDGLSREEVGANVSYNFDKYWTASLGQSRSFQPDAGPLLSSASLGYNDECFNLALIAERNATDRTDVATGDTFYLRLTFKNLGGINTPVGAGDVMDQSRLNTRR